MMSRTECRIANATAEKIDMLLRPLPNATGIAAVAAALTCYAEDTEEAIQLANALKQLMIGLLLNGSRRKKLRHE